ncbi:MAG: AraC family transcriptional regulator [Lachnospiraceae bacterium]|nr:AraC family transcriptional regulator [Lachnospiraceae bacterium]
MENRTDAVYLNFAGFQCLVDLQHSSIDLYLSTCGMQNCVGGHWYGPGKRDIYILHFISDGKGVFKHKGKTYQLSRGDVFLVKPGEEVYYQADEKNPWSYMWVGFEGVKASSYLAAAGLEGDTVITKCEDTTLVFTYIQQMIMNRQLTLANELKREAALLRILATMIDAHKATLPKDERYDYPYQIYVEQAIAYIQQNIQSNIKVNDIATYIGIDRSYLTNIFKQVTNVSPQEYLVVYRMEMAERLLADKDRKISDIANKVGYADPMTFSKMFKKYKGVSPKEYRDN